MYKFQNENDFREWLIENLDSYYADMLKEFDNIFDEWLYEVIKATSNAQTSIEISARLSKDGTPKIYYFGVDYVEDYDGQYDIEITF